MRIDHRENWLCREFDMSEVFREIVDHLGKPGNIERFVNIEVRVCDTLMDVDESSLDGPGRERLRKFTKDKKYEVVRGEASVRWKSDVDFEDCRRFIKHHPVPQRWDRIREFVEKMKQGDFPTFAHAYLHSSLTGADGLIFIDGTRRMLAYMEFGSDEMPVVVFRAVAKGK